MGDSIGSMGLMGEGMYHSPLQETRKNLYAARESKGEPTNVHIISRSLELPISTIPFAYGSALVAKA
jgi:hypothetical protein